MSKPLTFYRTNSVIRITPDVRRGVFWIDGTVTLPNAPKGMPEKGVPKYDWDEKLLIALSPEEGLSLSECASHILSSKEGKVEFFHDLKKGGREGEPKSLSLSFQQTDKGDRVFLSLSQAEAKVSVVLSRPDLYALAALIPQAVCVMWDWTGTLPPHDVAPGANLEEHEPGSLDMDDEVPF